MALDKLVDSTQLDSDLTSVANAIRTKGGTSANLAFPVDFISAIGNISSGGGSETETVEIEVSAYKSYDSAMAFLDEYRVIAPYNYYYVKTVFRNNTENNRAGILLEAVQSPNGRFGLVKRVGKTSNDLSYGIDVYAGATIAFTFIELSY